MTNQEKLQLGRRVAGVSIVVSCFLSVLNVWIGYNAGSTSVVAAGIEFVGDVLASVFVLAGMILAAKPPDEEHPYGHGRIEILAGLTVGFILAAGGLGICVRSLQQIGDAHPPPALYAVWPLLTAVLLRSVMATVKFKIGRRIGSGSLMADAWNDAVDILSACAALVALGLTLSNPDRFIQADHYGGFAVGLFVIYTGLGVLRASSRELIDTMPSPELVAEIRRNSMDVPGVLGVEKCMGRKTGLQYHIDLHVEVDPEITVAASHDIATKVRAHLRRTIDEVADVLVHVEPHGLGMQESVK